MTHDRRGPSRSGRALLAAVRWYQTAISPLLRPNCRYVPSCSAYAVEAIECLGVGRGLWLTVRRLSRCHPLHRGGYDPVPRPDRFRTVGTYTPVVPDVQLSHHTPPPRRGSVQQVESHP